MDSEELLFISSTLFEDNKPLTDIPFCKKNENKSKDFIKKFHHFTPDKYLFSIKWITKKAKS